MIMFHALKPYEYFAIEYYTMILQQWVYTLHKSNNVQELYHLYKITAGAQTGLD